MNFPWREQRLLNEFRGLPLNREEANKASAKPIDSLVEVLLNRYQIGQCKPEETIMGHWRELMGDVNAYRCSPVRIDAQSILHVAVGNPVLRRELIFEEKKILGRLRELPGCDFIREVRFVAG